MGAALSLPVRWRFLLLSRLAARAGFVTQRQTFVCRCQNCGMVCSHQATCAAAVANTRSRPTLYGCSSRRSLTGHLNSGVDGVFEAVRVVGRGLVSIAEVHAKVARAHLAQSEPEMARDRFGFLERHGFRKLFRRCIAASDPWSPIDAASSNQLREM